MVFRFNQKWVPLLVLLAIQLSLLPLHAQVDTIPVKEQFENNDLIEDFLLNSGAEGDFDFNTIFEDLEYLIEKPMNLNKATREDLEELRLLSDIQINDLLRYRKELGDLIATQELQSISSFDLNTIQRILPYVRVSGGLDDYNVPIPTMLLKGKNEIFLRWRRTLEQQRGYIVPEGETQSRYLGDPNKLYVRYKHSYENRLSYGFTMEKDEGEEFFKGSNKQGFDYNSAHIALKNYSKVVKDLVIGDFNVSFGQGLIVFSGFGGGKGADVMNIKRSSRNIRAYTSVSEFNFMRGAGITLGLTDNLQLTTFGSYKNSDANLGVIDTLDADQEIRFVTSLQSSGLHRTLAEIEDEGSIKQFATGASLKYHTDFFHVSLNGLYNKLNQDLVRSPRPYNRFFFSGNQLMNASIDYSFIYKNFNFFGETAMSDNGRFATTNGVLIGLDRNMDLAILHRSFAKDYQALDANPFQEGSGGRNESGLYIGLEVRPSNNWKIKTFFDIYEHPWLRLNVDAPSKGNEFRTRITYFQKRKLEAFIEIRREESEKNAPVDAFFTKSDYLVKQTRFQTRFHVSNKLSKALELRSRIDVGFFKNGVDEGSSKGVALYQDVIYKPMLFPFHFTARFSIFDSETYDNRFYSYENNLLYTYGIPAYYNRGTRFYINARYKGIRNMTIEARIAQTYWADQATFSSGLQQINGQTRTEVSAQIKYQF